LQYTGDGAFVHNELYSVLRGMIGWHERGTRYGIRMDSDGLLNAGEPGVQLTWMDAKVGDWVVTPRHGKPVEIQALWYNALMIMRSLAERFDDPASAERFAAMAAKASDSFNARFWNEETGCLCDVISGGSRDSSIRPNQIFAVSLPYEMLPADRARAVVEKVRQELLTPVGLRSLARGDSQYRPIYQGDVPSRDGAYHQGTVWPWLLGPFITAYVKVNNGSAEARREAEAFLAPLEAHLSDAGLGQISEIFDAEPPHLPRGCYAQAWSVAEILRAIVEDLARPERAGDDPGAIQEPARAASIATGG
jgi:predicted glycogen debranching enzyme